MRHGPFPSAQKYRSNSGLQEINAGVKKTLSNSMASRYNGMRSRFHIGMLESLRNPSPKSPWRVPWNKCKKFVITSVI